MKKIDGRNSDNQYKDKSFTVVNPTFAKLITAIEHLKKQETITIILSGNAIDKDYWLMTKNYPENLWQVASIKSKTNIVQQLFNLLPHIVKPEKIAYLRGKLSKYPLKLYDWMYNNRFEKQTTFTTDGNKTGVNFVEYSINFSRLHIELLKYIEENGGSIKLSEKEQGKINLPKTINYETLNQLNNLEIELSSAYKITNEEALEEIVNEQFDIAKQIKIDYKDFRKLFFKYGKHIEIITEKAYEFYDEYHNGEKSWKQAESWYQKRYEWWMSEKKLPPIE